MKEFYPDYNADIERNISWQYENASKLKSLIIQKKNWITANNSAFWQDWYRNIFNLETANSFGLNVWGKILNLNRKLNKRNGGFIDLNDEMYRLLLYGRLFRYLNPCTISDCQKYVNIIFSMYFERNPNFHAVVYDNLDMSVTYFIQNADNNVRELLDNVDFLPHPAGVQVKIIHIDILSTFGFLGQELETFNNGTFNNIL